MHIKTKNFIILMPILILLLLTFLLLNFYANKNIPFLPMDINKISEIQINNIYNNRIASDDEKNDILTVVNSYTKCNYKKIMPIYGNGKPSYANIQIFTGGRARNYCYILPYDENSILLSRPQSGIGYVIKTDELNKYFPAK